MANVTTGTQTTYEEMKPTRDELLDYIDELLDYIDGISDLISCKAVNIMGYKPTKFENVVLEYDYERLTECVNIVNKFKKNYKDIPI